LRHLAALGGKTRAAATPAPGARIAKTLSVPMGHPSPLRAPHGTIRLDTERTLSLGECIGHGSRSAVHVGWLQTGPHRLVHRVAVKVFDPPEHDDPQLVPSLARAARHAALVSHPNVVGVRDFGVDGDRPFIVMDHVHGMSLAHLLGRYAAANRRIPLDLALFVGIEVGEALLGARMAKTPEGKPLNMSHHDLSAREVLLSYEGEVRVGDFGVGLAAGSTSSGVRDVSKVASRIATMAPEVARGARGDARADVFALGVMLHEMLVGPRFPKGLPKLEAYEHAREGLVAPNPLARALPDPVRAVLDRCLRVDPAERPAHGGVVAYDLRKAALAMGVGDARVFLRSALFEMSEGLAGATDADAG
jgi:serine/threonine-protein kinase